jgi:hypothetical protein
MADCWLASGFSEWPLPAIRATLASTRSSDEVDGNKRDSEKNKPKRFHELDGGLQPCVECGIYLLRSARFGEEQTLKIVLLQPPAVS